MIRAVFVFLAFAGPFLIVGYMNAQDITACEKAGNPRATCYQIFNP